MSYAVRIHEQAEQAMFDQARYIAADKPRAAEQWLVAMWGAIEALETMPRRHPIAQEISVDVGAPIHKLIVGNYVIFFRIDDDANVVEVLHFRHGGRSPDRL